MHSFWDERYAAEEFIYGKQPNLFFAEELMKLPAGKILLPGEGEGRNATFAAGKGWQADAVDFSFAARNKALLLAKEQGVALNSYKIADLGQFEPKTGFYDAVSLIFVHLEPETRKRLHQRLAQSLKPGGSLIAEFFSIQQLNKKSGGPKNPLMLYRPEDLLADFKALDIKHLIEAEVHLNESRFHEGVASVIRIVATKKIADQGVGG